MGTELERLRDKMATAVSILHWEMGNMWGHVSVRSPDAGRFLLMHLRPPEDPALPANEVLEYDLDGNLISGRRDEPDEIYFYTCLYQAKNDAAAVVHTHPEMALALTAAGQKVVPIHLASRRFGQGVPIAPWLYGFWREDGEQAAELMGNGCALMMQGHGALVTGKSLEEACMSTVSLERTAKMLLLGAPFGKVTPLSQDVLDRLQQVARERAARVGRRSQSLFAGQLEWHYYESLVKKGERWSKP